MKSTPGSRWRLIGLVVLIGLIILIFTLFVDLRIVVRQLLAADFRYLLAASLSLVVGLLAYAGRWRLLLAGKSSLRQTFHASNIGHAGNIIIPARAGEAVRIAAISSNQVVSVTEATSSFIVERLFEQIMRLLALAGAVAYGVGIEISVAGVAGVISFLAITFGIILWLITHQETTLDHGPRWLTRLPRVSEDRARRSLTDFLANLSAVSAPPQLARALFWSLVSWCFFLGFFYLTLLALADGFMLEDRLAVSLGALALSPPSAPTQPGVFHASVVAPLAAVGYQAEPLTVYAVVLHFLEMFWMIGLAWWGVTQMRLSPRVLWVKSRH